MISYMGGPKLGDTRSGAIASLFGITIAIVSGGLLCIAGVMMTCLLMPRFWTYHQAPRQKQDKPCQE
jgi:hypothetical protein